MSVVLDSSATIAWLMANERDEAIESLFDQVAENGAIAPSLWRLEVANVLTMSVRRNRLSSQGRYSAIEDLKALAIAVDAETADHAFGASLRLADIYGLTVYDAAYLELAERRRLPLATLDKELARAALNSGVELALPFSLS